MRTPAPAITRAVARAVALSIALAAPAAGTAAAQPGYTPAAAAPAAPATAPATAPAGSPWTGVYRISLSRAGETVPARVLMEWVDGALYGTFLMDNVASALGRVHGDASEFRATMVTAAGRGEIVLRATADGVAGTLTVGRTSWEIRGARTT